MKRGSLGLYDETINGKGLTLHRGYWALVLV